MPRPWHGLPQSIGVSVAARWRKHIGVSARNRLRNGGFQVNQRNPGAAYTSTSVFPNGVKAPVLDFWIAQGDGADACDVSQELTTIPTGSYAAILLDAETPDKKFGLAQFVESRDCVDLRSGKCSLQFKARVGGAANIANIRAAVIEWTGATVDDPTATLAAGGSWGAAGANPTLAAGWAYISTPANLAMTTSFQTFLIENISVGSGAKNLGVFIWVDDTVVPAGSFLYLADGKLEEGPYCTRFEQPDFTEELQAAQRRFKKSFNYATVPAQNAGVTGALHMFPSAAITAFWSWHFNFPMLRAPTLVTYNPSNTNADGRDIVDNQDLTLGTPVLGESHLYIPSTDGDINPSKACAIHVTLEAEFQA